MTSLASGPISLGKGGSFFEILLRCVRQIWSVLWRDYNWRLAENCGWWSGRTHTWQCLCVSSHLHQRWRVIRQSKARTSTRRGSTSPPPGMHESSQPWLWLNRLKEKSQQSAHTFRNTEGRAWGAWFDWTDDSIKHKTTNYLVMSRLSAFHNFWSHIFNGAADRKRPFHLF